MLSRSRIAAFFSRRALDQASAASPRRSQHDSERAAVFAFQRAARSVPAYRALLAEQRVDPARVRNIRDFRRLVPICDKQRVFGAHGVRALCRNGELLRRGSVFTSSGWSGAFSFGFESGSSDRRTRACVDALLDRYFDVVRRPTLLLNLLPGGVRVPSRHVLIADLGPRVEAALATLRRIGGEFDQRILVAEPLLLKALVDAAAESHFAWDRLRVHVIAGGDFVPENFRAYLGQRLAHDERHPERGQVLTSFGVSEIALSLAHETPELRRIRRVLHEQPSLRSAIFPSAAVAPALLSYIPQLHYLETTLARGQRRLTVTTLDARRTIPLIRYDTGDSVELLSSDTLAQRLSRIGLSALAPRSRLPVLVSSGRGGSLRCRDRQVFPEQALEALYASAEVADVCTGQLLVQAPREDRVSVRVQCRHDRRPTARASERLRELLDRYCGPGVGLIWDDYASFGRGLELSYQKKPSRL